MLVTQLIVFANEQDHLVTAELRKVGHELLLKAGDSTSLVLPIVKDSNRYVLSFAEELSIIPEDLVILTNRIINKSNLATGYLIEVYKCGAKDIVYSYFNANVSKGEEITCKERVLPKSCYTILFKVANPIKKNEEDFTDGNGNNKQSEDLVMYFVIGVGIMLMIVTWIVRKQRLKAAAINSNFIPIGKYRFDRKNSLLILPEQQIELTSKETELLSLLYAYVNETVPRDAILKEVWGDEGDYIGRTLDVFISKLRKKLEADANIKIVNVRGVGYKLVVN